MTKFLLSIAFASLLVGCERQRSNYAEEASIPQQVEGLNAHGDCNQLVNQNMSILAANRATLVRVCIQLMKEGNLEGIEPESVTSKLLGISQLYQLQRNDEILKESCPDDYNSAQERYQKFLGEVFVQASLDVLIQ